MRRRQFIRTATFPIWGSVLAWLPDIISASQLTAYQQDDLNLITEIVEVIATDEFSYVDIHDIKTVLSDGGQLVIGKCLGRTPNELKQETMKMISTGWYFDESLCDAGGVIIIIRTGNQISLMDSQDLADIIMQGCNPNADVVFTYLRDETITNKCEVMVIATRFKSDHFITNGDSTNQVNSVKSMLKKMFS